MHNIYHGHCKCGDGVIELGLPHLLEEYIGRQCDCEFCTDRAIKYISDPKGNLKIVSGSPLKIYRQGSNQADFLACSICDSVLAVSYKKNNQDYAALNVNVLLEQHRIIKYQTISPKLLSKKEKTSRWTELWMDLQINL